MVQPLNKRQRASELCVCVIAAVGALADAFEPHAAQSALIFIVVFTIMPWRR